MWQIEPNGKFITYDDITLDQLRHWAKAAGLIVTKISVRVKRPWLVSKLHKSGDVDLLYKGKTEKETLWAVYRKDHLTT